MQYTITLQKAYKLEANATSMSTSKNQQFLFKNLEKQRVTQNIIKELIILLLMSRKLQTRYLF